MTTASAGARVGSRSAWASLSATGTGTALALAARRRVGRALASLATGSEPDLRPSTCLVIPSLRDNSRLIAAPHSTLTPGRRRSSAVTARRRRRARHDGMLKIVGHELARSRGSLCGPCGPARLSFLGVSGTKRDEAFVAEDRRAATVDSEPAPPSLLLNLAIGPWLGCVAAE